MGKEDIQLVILSPKAACQQELIHFSCKRSVARDSSGQAHLKYVSFFQVV